MTITLRDPTDHRFAPTTAPSSTGGAELIAPRTLAEELLAGFRTGGMEAGISFELESHGGYAHTVSGTIAYLDEEARTFMVREAGGRLTPVPLRDVTGWLAATSDASLQEPARDGEGLGTGVRRSAPEGGRAR